MINLRFIFWLAVLIAYPCSMLAQSSGPTPPPPPTCSPSIAGQLYTDTGTSPATVYTCSYYNLAWQWVVNPSYGGLVYYPTVPTTCSGALPAFLAGWPNTQEYVCVNGVPDAIGGAGSGVTTFAAPSASWPTWLVPTVTNPASTPSLAVAAGTVPLANGGTGATTAAGANLNITGVTQTGTLGTSSQVSTFPGTVAAGTAVNVGGQISGNSLTITNLSSIPSSWTVDVSSPTTARTSIGAASSTAGMVLNGIATALGGTYTITTPALNPGGIYSSIATYLTGDLVTSGGLDWVCITACSGVTPIAGANWMQLIVSPGTCSNIPTVTSTYTSTTADCFVRANGTFTVNLPASPYFNEEDGVINIGSGTITVNGNGNNIGTVSTFVLSNLIGGTQQPSAKFVFDTNTNTWNAF